MNKKLKSIIMFVLSLILLFSQYLFLSGDELKSVRGIFIGIGASLFGLSISNFYMIHFNKTHQKELKESMIEFNDERNTMIRNKAKAAVCDIIQWMIMGIAYITILINAPLWVTLLVVAVFLLKNILEVYFMNKYKKIL